AVEAVPKDVVMNLKPSRIEANYKNETFYGDWVTARTQKIKTGDSPCFIHKLVRDKDENDIARLRTEWSEY
ncbi:MAG: hypothetical protein GF421_12985, partial [Candidatus Aminicenantes bacterium]|nr:hypothetical protein [Candidatus Aminicenantes bacterium]